MEKFYLQTIWKSPPEQTFTKTIHPDSPFYEKTGEYRIKLDYGQISANNYFVMGDDSSESEIPVQINTALEVILLYTKKNNILTMM